MCARVSWLCLFLCVSGPLTRKGHQELCLQGHLDSGGLATHCTLRCTSGSLLLSPSLHSTTIYLESKDSKKSQRLHSASFLACAGCSCWGCWQASWARLGPSWATLAVRVWRYMGGL